MEGFFVSYDVSPLNGSNLFNLNDMHFYQELIQIRAIVKKHGKEGFKNAGRRLRTDGKECECFELVNLLHIIHRLTCLVAAYIEARKKNI